MNELAWEIARRLQTFAGTAVSDFVLDEAKDEPTPSITLRFTMYDYFRMQFSYDRGYYGFGIEAGTGVVSVRLDDSRFTTVDELSNSFGALVKDVRSRIPDKYLESHGWA